MDAESDLPAGSRGRPAPATRGLGRGSARQALLLSIVAHELRAPLNSLLAGSELLVDHLDELDPAHQRDLVTSLHRGSLRLRRLVENLLSVSSLLAGGCAVQRCWTDPLRLVADVEPDVQPMLQKKAQVLRISAHHDLPPVFADPNGIQQVLDNLVANASKFAPDQSTIDLRLHRRPAALRVIVADRGPGLPPGSPRRLFEPYERGDPTVSGSVEGIGLGLFIVKAIVAAHEGRVGAGNRRRGGAAFWFELPWPPP